MEDKKYSLGGFTFDTQQEYERAKVELQVILKIKQKYDINNPEDAQNVLDAVNKKGDVFKSSVGKAFINKLKRVSKNENEIHVQKPVPEQKVRYKQEEKGQDRVIIPIIAEGKKKSDIKYHIIFFMTFLFAAKKNKKKADEYIYNHLTAEEKEKFENKKIKDKEFADNSRYIIKILMFILMIVCPPLLVIFIIFMLVVKSSSKIKWLIHNWKSGVMNVMYYIALAMAEATPIVAAYYFNIQISIITVLVPAILISVITYAIIRATHKSQFYLAMRNIAMYPIVILLTLLPFALTGAMAYIGYTAKTAVNNVNGGGNPYGGTGPDFVYDNPPVYQVSGYSYYNSHGTFVVVGPSMRTMPDASVYNNLSYKG